MRSMIRIGGASGALIDSSLAVPQLLSVDGLDYLIFDYLGEGSMGIFGRLAAQNPQGGFGADFVDFHVGPYLAEVKARGIKAVTNAGGLNPRGLAAALKRKAAELGFDLTVAAIEGDDLRSEVEALRREGHRDMFSGAPFPEKVIAANAYLGAFPIAAALARGADIVVTGRVVDSALALGPLIHEFGWGPDDFDKLAAGTAAGHLLECGAQVSGGTFTDWQDVPNWENSGYPVGECHADGTIIITKPAETGGLVSVGTVSEQLLYEVGDPQAYIVPDVVCDFSAATVEQIGPDRVRVAGIKGYPPTDSCKLCVIHEAGWRAVALTPVIGIDAIAKARRQADAVLARMATLLPARGLGDWRGTHVEILGSEATFGTHGRIRDNREVVCKIVVDHDDRRATDLFWREQTSAIMNMSVGTAITLALAMPPSFPITGLFSCLLPKRRVTARLVLDDREEVVPDPTHGGFAPGMIERPPVPSPDTAGSVPVKLIALAWARSGDKGNLFNVGVIARDPAALPHIRAALTPEAVAAWYAACTPGDPPPRVEVFDVPGFHAVNLLVHDSLAGGQNRSPRLDAAAKGMAQHLLEFPVPVPPALAATV